MSKKNCEHRKFWEIYKILNTKNVWSKGGQNFSCKSCNQMCNASWLNNNNCESQTFLQKISGCFLWMLPAILLILGVITYYMILLKNSRDISDFMLVSPAIFAIVLIIVFHFGAMFYISKSEKLVVKSKKL